MGYEYIDHSGDVGVHATGKTLGEVFADVALGMYAMVAKPDIVKPRRDMEVGVERETLEDTVVAWLNELVYLMDAHGFIGCTVEIHEATETSVQATVRGDEFDPSRHGGGLLVKAATYHGIRTVREGGEWVFEVIFDL
jgi:SHS2 domain-containing protein